MRYFFLLITTLSYAQQTQKVDFISMKGNVTVNENEKGIMGFITYQFIVLKPVDTIKIDAQNMEFSSVLINNKNTQFTNTGSQLVLLNNFKLGINSLSFNYFANPKKALYFIGKDENLQVWTQGQGKYTSNWLPSFDDVNEKVIFNLSIIFKNDFEVISNGILKSVTSNSQGNLKSWNYEMKHPMSSYLLMLAIGKFDKTVLKSKSGISLELYLKPTDATHFKTTYKHSKKIFDFLEKEIGVKYPWEIYRQVPIFDFLYAGMENTTSTLFSQDYVVDQLGFNDANYINVNAHELAHQWFGNLITAKTGKDHWLQEGFATYFALLSEQNIFGEDYFYSQLYSNYEEIKFASNDTIPILSPKASSTTFYKKGAMALHVLRTEIGTEKFQKAIKNYLIKYSFKNVDTDDFLSEIKAVSGYNVEIFKKTYLETSKNDSLYLKYLKKWKQYKYIHQLENINDKNKTEVYTSILGNLKIDPLVKLKIFEKLVGYSFKDKKQFLDIALNDKRLEVQKGILNSISNYPPEYDEKMERIFNLLSYSVKRDFLNNVTLTEEQRFKFLNKSEKLSEKNILLRISWLKTALKFPIYLPSKKQEFESELNKYSSSNYSIYNRIAVFKSLNVLETQNKMSLENLFLATKHHNWNMVSYVKILIESFLINENQRNRIIDFQKTTTPEINEIVQKYLDKIKVN